MSESGMFRMFWLRICPEVNTEVELWDKLGSSRVRWCARESAPTRGPGAPPRRPGGPSLQGRERAGKTAAKASESRRAGPARPPRARIVTGRGK